MSWDACSKWVMTRTDVIMNPQLEIHSTDEHRNHDGVANQRSTVHIPGIPLRLFRVTREKSEGTYCSVTLNMAASSSTIAT